MRRLPFRSISLAIALFSSQITTATEFQLPDYAKEREVYQLAQKALHNSDIEQFESLKSSISHYPLTPYLEFDQLKREFSHLPTGQIDAFLIAYKGEYIARRIKANWLSYLGANQYWSLFQQYYNESHATHKNQCYLQRARLATITSKTRTLLDSQELWLKGYSMPNTCDPLFKELDNRGFITANMALERFQLAYAAKNDSLAKALIKRLKPKHQSTAKKLFSPSQHTDYWITELSKPVQTLPFESAVIKRLLIKLSNSNNEVIATLMTNYQLSNLTETDRLEVKRLNAWYVAKNSGSDAHLWLNQQQEHEDSSLVEQQLRFSLQAKDWQLYQTSYDKADNQLQDRAEWRYWLAMSKLQGEKTDARKAEKILKTLAKERHYYGFLAARFFKQDVFIKNTEYSHTQNVSKAIYQRLAAAIELHLLGERVLSNREWFHSTRFLPNKRWAEAATLANKVNWHERAIHAYAKARQFEAVDQRFPLAFSNSFSDNATKTGVDASWLLAMARQESAFAPLAQSHKGARGILQLMPQTAKKVARKHNIRYSVKALYEPEYNIQLASLYVKEMLETFEHNYILATAAYNAGPSRVREWLSLRPMDDDWAHWVATIPYKETRNYVQNILAYSRIYQSKMPEDNLKLTLFQQDKTDEI